jgi:hypothetical protein
MSGTACGYLKQHYQATPALDTEGRAVSSIQTAKVGFTRIAK